MRRRVMVVTGTRAEFGLLRSTMAAIDSEPRLDLLVVAAGAHLLPPARTIEEVVAAFDVEAEVAMQVPGETGRVADAVALGRGVSGFAEVIERIRPDFVVVLGDRIEAFAAASAAAIAGVALVHLHGGDRAEGVADEAMRHAISQLADVHFPATPASGERLLRMGQPSNSVHVVGSPAVDDLAAFPAITDERLRHLGDPRLVVLQHGSGLQDEMEAAWATAVLDAAREHGPVLVLEPNHDPGSGIVRKSIAKRVEAGLVQSRLHLPRPEFIGLLRRVDAVVGNSSAGLIEAAIVGCPAVNVGPRQGGRERPGSVIDVERADQGEILGAIRRAAGSDRKIDHPYGVPGVGGRIASSLAGQPLPAPRKRLAH